MVKFYARLERIKNPLKPYLEFDDFPRIEINISKEYVFQYSIYGGDFLEITEDSLRRRINPEFRLVRIVSEMN